MKKRDDDEHEGCKKREREKEKVKSKIIWRSKKINLTIVLENDCSNLIFEFKGRSFSGEPQIPYSRDFAICIRFVIIMFPLAATFHIYNQVNFIFKMDYKILKILCG